MPQAHVALAKVEDVRDILWPLREGNRMAGLVMVMAREIERLEEDNVQLRAAINLYQEVVRVCRAQCIAPDGQRYPASRKSSNAAG